MISDRCSPSLARDRRIAPRSLSLHGTSPSAFLNRDGIRSTLSLPEAGGFCAENIEPILRTLARDHGHGAGPRVARAQRMLRRLMSAAVRSGDPSGIVASSL